MLVLVSCITSLLKVGWRSWGGGGVVICINKSRKIGISGVTSGDLEFV